MDVWSVGMSALDLMLEESADQPDSWINTNRKSCSKFAAIFRSKVSVSWRTYHGSKLLRGTSRSTSQMCVTSVASVISEAARPALMEKWNELFKLGKSWKPFLKWHSDVMVRQGATLHEIWPAPSSNYP